MPVDIVGHLAALPGAVAEAMKEGRTQRGRQLTDPRGLGKPPAFSGMEADFTIWSRKTENYVVSVFPESRDLLHVAAESLVEVDVDTLKADPDLPDDAIIDEVNGQLYSCLMALTSDEPFDISVGAGLGCGLEAWRRLHKRYDPLTAGRSRGLLREVLAPEKSTISTSRHNIEKLEEKMRRYCHRRDGIGAKLTLAEDIRVASLEATLPDELERHVHLNRARLTTYDKLRA